MAPGLSVNRELHQVYSEVLMRSDLVFGAMANVPNRYLLSQLASKAARKLHRPGTRMQDTTNDVLARFSRSNPMASARPLRVSQARPVHPQKTPPVFPHQPEVAKFIPARERVNPLWEAARVLGA
jgi:hypothetical protein